MLLRLVYILISFIFLTVSGAAASSGVGVIRLKVVDPLDHRPMNAVAFFPSSEATETTKIGPYEVAASRDVAVEEGRYPLVLLSHGNMGSMWGHHDLVTTLARSGYIVVSLMHPGDNFEDASRVGKVSSIYGRPVQAAAALDAALGEPLLSKHIDHGKIGFIGFSAGGTTGLIIADARPRFDFLERYCSDQPDNRGLCEGKGRIEIDQPKLEPMSDSRIRSFVLLAPVSVMFPPEELQRITAPALVIVGDKDEELSAEDNAIALQRQLLSKAQLKVIPDAGHFTFLAPCSAELQRAVPALCQDRQGVDRAALHEGLNADIAEFFGQTIGVDAP